MAAQSKLIITEADVPARPPKLAKTATAEEKAERASLMEQRRKLLERLREQTREREKRDRSQRTRPCKLDEAARRAQQRARIAASIALAAVAAAVVPITNESEGQLIKLLNSAVDHWELHKAADNLSIKADYEVEAALSLFMSKLHGSMKLQPALPPPPPSYMLALLDDDDCKHNQEVCAPSATLA